MSKRNTLEVANPSLVPTQKAGRHSSTVRHQIMDSLPEGSRIKIERQEGYEKIVIQHPSGGLIRIFVSLFMFFWLGGWGAGWVSAVSSLTKGDRAPSAFLIFWLCGWTIGGIFAVYFLFRLLRPSVPETLLLSRPNLKYDSGVAPFQMSFDFNSQKDIWKRFFRKRTQTELAPSEMASLSLREFESGNRLTVDKGSKRLNIAESATEIEREWLYKTIKRRYS